jgi:hypothetical protein
VNDGLSQSGCEEKHRVVASIAASLLLPLDNQQLTGLICTVLTEEGKRNPPLLLTIADGDSYTDLARD